MDWQHLLTENVLKAFALDFGLIILAVWFFILLLILREFRQFARTMAGNGVDQQMLTLVQKSVDNALITVSENTKTLGDLVEVQQALENQVTNIKQSSSSGHMTEEDQTAIDDLTKKLSTSHQLIKKLKGDLDRSVQGLKKTKDKLYNQFQTVEGLKEENERLQKDFSQLEKEYINISQANGLQKAEEEKKELIATLNQYKRQIEEQDQAINQLKEQGSGAGNLEIEAVQEELSNAQKKLQSLTKEKDFVEKKFLTLLKEIEKPKP
ncbi:chromosome partitioning protein ParA [Vibrio sp. S4M6]|uniref:chromosome partitioning protein ParA n=1 Tax=Vibrio sinus TaxID=2946865 RepID=UPI00202A5CC3|nr:chromosome partitioning protein ParA [Vibrio sinus]MCL9782905.1 chromosome partitioning protein ParA [Vibrio sinus]